MLLSRPLTAILSNESDIRGYLSFKTIPQIASYSYYPSLQPRGSVKTLLLVILVVSVLLVAAVGTAVYFYTSTKHSVQSTGRSIAPTWTSVLCNPDPIGLGEPTVCTGTVIDRSQNPTSATGNVTFLVPVGVNVTFSPGPTCVLVESIHSYAKCSVTVTVKSASLNISAKYSGDGTHEASDAGWIIIAVSGYPYRHLTSTNLVCAPQPIEIGQSTSCTVTVIDSSSAGATPPTGVVLFTNGASCTLGGAGGSATCTVSFTPPLTAGGQAVIYANYPGDATHLLSSVYTNVSVLEPPCQYNASISSHVYNPSRLQIVKQCITAQGMVDRVIEEPDGDIHIRLVLDPVYSNLTNTANDQYQYGALVVEIICVGPITQPDAVSACQGYTNTISAPNVGKHITITGPYVLDTEHYSWAEIHPVYSLTIGASYPGAAVRVEQNLSISYPGGATTGWLGPTPRNSVASLTVGFSAQQFTETLSLYSTSTIDEQITSIAISTPGYSIVSISPSTPISFGPMASVDITLTLQAPDSYYHGPIDLEIVTA